VIKTTLAAVMAFLVAHRLGTSQQPLLAPLTAILVVQLTMYETVARAMQRVASVMAGVLIALAIATVVGLTWWTLGLAVGASLVCGRLLRLGPHLVEVPISAMLVLAVGDADHVAAARVYETMIGSGVGIAVTAALLPPLYVRPAGDALAGCASAMTTLLQGLAAELADGWSRGAADHWLNEARDLSAKVARADAALAQAEKSSRLNPRAARTPGVQARLRSGLTGLEHCQVTLRSLCRALLDRAYFVPPEEESGAYGDEARAAIAAVLRALGDAIAAVPRVLTEGEASEPARNEVSLRLLEAKRRRDRLAELLAVDPQEDQGAWQQHGALLAAIDRLRVEVEATARPPDVPSRPSRLAERQRRAVRRIATSRVARAK
jgi:hypothetical protein